MFEDALNILADGGEKKDIFLHMMEIGQLKKVEVEACLTDPYYYDYLKYSSLFDMFVITNQITLEKLKQELNLYKKAQLDDQAAEAVKKSGKREFGARIVEPSKRTIYLDQNMLSDYSNSFDIAEKMKCLKKHYDFCYGPSHLEEINKISGDEDQKRMMDSITSLTDNLIILPTPDDYVFAIEEPHWGLKRVQAFPGGTEAVEERRVISSSDRKLFLPKYEDDIHKKKIGTNKSIFEELSDDAFKELLAYSESRFQSKEDIKSFSDRSSYVHAMYTLFISLDLLSYKIDNKDRTIRSSAHDIEHLISASKVDFFISKDKKLCQRAKQIYSFLGVDTVVLNQNEYVDVLEKS